MIKFEDLDVSKYADGLVPAIVQDDKTLRVLMMGFMNAEALEKTQKEGRVTFWSRSRNKLWTKGEESGNYLEFVSLAADCDKDTLLVRANPHGPTCHKGTTTCWGEYSDDAEGFIRELEGVVQQRHKEMPAESYTTFLFEKGPKKIAKKLGEEATETVIEAIAGDKERLVSEASDVIYHLLVLLEYYGLGIKDIEKELIIRHKPGYVHQKDKY